MLVTISFKILFFFHSAEALIKPQMIDAGKAPTAIAQGLFIGGEQGRQISLLELRLKSERKRERLLIKFGEAGGEPLNGPLPFFQISVSRDPPRIVIDLAQVQRTKVELMDIQRTLRGSHWVTRADFTMDPEDVSTNLTLHLKHPLSVRVLGHTDDGTIVLDAGAP